MCYRCDYMSLLRKGGLDYTAHRLTVLEIIGNSSSPLTAQAIFETMSRTQGVNRVTVYRILDLLVKRELVDRITGGDRSFYYGLAPNANHPPHAHFHCKGCGSIECLNPEGLQLDMGFVERTFPGWIEKAEVRLDGLCKNCLKREKS